MDVIKSPDFYINYKKSQFKTPIEVLKKNFKNLQKLIEKNNLLINKQLANIKATTNKKEKLALIDKLIEHEKLLQKRVATRVKQHCEYVNRLVLRIQKLDHINDLYNKYSHMTKKDLDAGLPKDLQEFYRTENNLLIVEYLLRQYNLDDVKDSENKAILLSKQLELDKYFDADVILQGLKIRDEIVNKKNLKLLKQWCTENKKNLIHIRESFPQLVTSDIEFECDFQEFIEKINKGEYGKALVYGRKNLSDRYITDRFAKIAKGSSVIWSKFILEKFNEKELNKKNSKYANKYDDDVFDYYSSNSRQQSATRFKNMFMDMLSSKTWDNLGHFFALNFKLLYGMNQIPPLETMLSIGGSVLKTKSCIHSAASSTRTGFQSFISDPSTTDDPLKKYMESTECPICSVELNSITDPLPYSLQTKSNLFDDPVMLPNKHIYSYKQLMFFNRESLGGATSPSEAVVKGVTSADGHLMIDTFDKERLVFPDHTRSNTAIVDPSTEETFFLQALEKVFPT